MAQGPLDWRASEGDQGAVSSAVGSQKKKRQLCEKSRQIRGSVSRAS